MNNKYKNIFNKLVELKDNAYCPYSNFFVTAIVKADNKFYYGVNIENSAYPSGTCAERSAISTAISYGAKNIDELYLLTNSIKFGSPCGNCRQFMSEFMNDDCKIIIFNMNGEFKELLICDLLPFKFTKNNLIK